MDLRPGLNINADRRTLSAVLAAHVAELAATAIAKTNRFCLALSGGSLMNIIGPPLSSLPLRDNVDWSSWHVFWVDERWVSWSNPESNYGLAKALFLDRTDIPDAQIHAVDNSLSPSETAHAYASAMATVFQAPENRLPRFDLILLGIGADGHTASLFPNHPALDETRRWVVPVLNAPKPPPIRITMTLPVINRARHIRFVAAGPDKAKIVSAVLDPKAKQPELPARRVNPSDGDVQWFVDQSAAGQYHPYD